MKEIYPPLNIDIEEYLNNNGNESPTRIAEFLFKKYPKRWKDKHSARPCISRILNSKKDKKDNIKTIIYPLDLIHNKCGKKRKINVKFIFDKSKAGLGIKKNQLSKCFHCEKNKKYNRFFITKNRIEKSLGQKISDIINDILAYQDKKNRGIT